MSLEIRGLKKLQRRFAALTEGIDPISLAVLKKIAKEVKEEAKERVPVDTGSLKKSIRVISTAKKAKHITRVGVRAGGYETNPRTGQLVNYAIYVEFGTSRQAPQPYLIPSASKKGIKIMNEILKAIKQKLLEVI